LTIKTSRLKKALTYSLHFPEEELLWPVIIMN